MKEAKSAGYSLPKDADMVNASQDMVKVLMLKSTVEESRSELGVNIYDIRGNEMLADQFALRLGYGKPLATALKRIVTPFNGYIGGSLMLVMSMISAYSVAYGAVIAASGVAGIMGPIYFAHLLLKWSMVSSEENNTLYDKPKKRLDVIRQQMSKELSNKSIDAKHRKELIASIDEIEKLMKPIVDIPNLYRVFWRIAPWNRSKVKTIKLQQMLEKLGNNRAHEAASRLED